VNDEYLAILEDEAVIASQIARLEQLLGRARVLGERNLSSGVVVIGSTVEVGDTRTRATHRYRVVDAFEGGVKGAVTACSPIGEALIGREIGDVVEIALPGGGARELCVLRVEAPGPDGA
jgi:transcription elongation factor GreA